MQVLNDVWNNWISPYFGGQSQQQPIENTPNVTENTPQEETTPLQESAGQPAASASPEEPEAAPTSKRKPIDHQKMELSELLGLFHKECDSDAEVRVQDSYGKVKTTQNKQKECTELYNLFSDPAHIASDETLTLPQNDTVVPLLQKAKAYGITIPDNKQTFTKQEREHILRQVERKTADLDVDLKIQMHEVTESTKRHDLETQMFKSIEDKQERAKERAIRGIGGN